MMSNYDLYQVISITVPLYISMLIGYGSVKWWKLFTKEQCLGISRFCSLFAVPVLSFYYITKTNLYEMNLKLLGADILQKVIVIAVLACWYKLDPRRSIEWLITIFSICTLPNVLILGLPIIKSMYHNIPLVVEIFLAQIMIWHPLLLIMYEYHAATIVIPDQQFGDTRDLDERQNVACRISFKDTTAEEAEATSITNFGGEEGEDLEIHIHQEGDDSSCDQSFAGNEQREIEEVPSTPMTEVIPETQYQRASNKPTSMSSISVMTKHIIIMVCKKLIVNPNSYATILGLVGAFVSSTFDIVMPLIVTHWITFLSNASLGMGMFNMGLSIARLPTLLPCGKVVAALTMVLRFIIGPVVMSWASLVIGLRGTIFHIAVAQAALSQGVVPSDFAVQYNVYPEVFNTGMTLGMVVVMPVTFLCYNLSEI